MEWRLSVDAKGYGRLVERIDTQDGGDRHLLLELHPAFDLELWVRAPWAEPPPSVELVFLDAADRALFARSYLTGPGGRLRLLQLPSGTLRIAARTPEGLVSPTISVSIPSTESAELPLSVAGRVEVLVPELIDSSNAARLESRNALGNPDPWSFQGSLFPGYRNIEGLAPGVWIFSVETPDGRQWSGRIEVEGGRSSTVFLEERTGGN